MKYALIKDGKCHNVIEADEEFVEKIRPEWDDIVLAEGTEAEVNASYDGKVFTRKEISAPTEPAQEKTELQEIKETLAQLVEDVGTIKNTMATAPVEAVEKT